MNLEQQQFVYCFEKSLIIGMTSDTLALRRMCFHTNLHTPYFMNEVKTITEERVFELL